MSNAGEMVVRITLAFPGNSSVCVVEVCGVGSIPSRTCGAKGRQDPMNESSSRLYCSDSMVIHSKCVGMCGRLESGLKCLLHFRAESSTWVLFCLSFPVESLFFMKNSYVYLKEEGK